MYLGVDYYPEHWDPSLIDADLERIVEMNANIIRIGEFAWHMMETNEGEYDFSYFDEFIKKAKAKGLKIMFGTPTATFPAWLAKKYPSILSEDEFGHKRHFGGRRQYCFNSEVYLAKATQITEKLVAHYKDEEAIISWQVDNEFGHEGSHMCYCDKCQDEFRNYLSNKYESIDELNETYGTIFWGQTYNNFNEIPAPKPTITTQNPSLRMDWINFRDYSINRFGKVLIDAIKANRREDQEVTHNFFGGSFNLAYDQNTMSEELDFVSFDNYPVWGGLREPLEPAEIALILDYVRGLKNENFWIVEEIMGAQGHDAIGYLPRPKQAQMWAYQAMAHGCENMMFFRYRGMTRGQEQFCFGIVDHDNTTGRKYHEVQEFFAHISTHKDAVKSKIKNDVAFLYDFNNNWSWKIQQQTSEFEIYNEVKRLYRSFFDLNVGCDVISTDKDLSDYKVVVIPVMKVMKPELVEKIEAFIKEGKTVIFTFRTGVKDASNNVYFEKPLPGLVDHMVGANVVEHEPLQEGQECVIKGVDGTNGEIGVWRDFLKPTTADVLYTYDDQFYSEFAAITKNEYKGGHVYYVGGGVDEATALNIMKQITDERGIETKESPKHLEVVTRIVDGKETHFVINHTSETLKWEDIEVAPYHVKIVEA
jgi:beta-galactosidase